MTVPLYLLLVYIVIVIIFSIFSIAGLYHLKRFTYSGDLSRIIIVIYSVVSIAVIIFSLSLLIIRTIEGV
jgi:hypothetical protein